MQWNSVLKQKLSKVGLLNFYSYVPADRFSKIIPFVSHICAPSSDGTNLLLQNIEQTTLHNIPEDTLQSLPWEPQIYQSCPN
jgi:hypothetical protein